MKLRLGRTKEEREAADEKVFSALAHLSLVLDELRLTLDKVESKRERGVSSS